MENIINALNNIITNHSMTLDEMLDCIGAEIIRSEYDERFSQDNDNVIWNGERYWYDEIEAEMNK